MKSTVRIVNKVLIVLLVSIASAKIACGQDQTDANKKYREYSDEKKFLGVAGRFEVLDVGTIVVYRQPGFYKTAKKTFYYFSLTMDSPIYPLSVHQLRKVFGENENKDLLKGLRSNRYRLAEKGEKHLVVNELLWEHKS